MAELQQKTILITGGTKGLGAAMAELLARHGASLIVTSRGASVGEIDAKAGSVTRTRLDVDQEKSVTDLFMRIDQAGLKLDVLINNAGIGMFKPLAQTSHEEWQRVLATNLTGSFLCAREAFIRMKAQGGGRIINIGSIVDHQAVAGSGAYGVSKFGVRALTEILNEDGKAFGIRASLVSPGAVFTEIWHGREGFDPVDMLRPEDVAQTVLDIVRRPLRVRIDEVKIVPPKGLL